MKIKTEKTHNHVDKILIYIKSEGLRRDFLAQRVGISHQYMSDILLKKRRLTEELRERIARALDIDLD